MRNGTWKRIISWVLALSCALLAAGALAETNEDRAYIRIEVQDHGVIYAELYPEYAPITVENFLSLVDRQFYDGLTFHRIISNFMVQGGDPQGNGTGGSGQNIKGEFSSNGVENPLAHERGVLSMARSQAPDSASSQFFIVHRAASHLDGQYAAFGKVVCGITVVDRLCQMTPVQDSNGTVLPEEQPVIASIRRADAEEVRQAVEAENDNGRAGRTYADPLSPLSFPVPAGWGRIGELGDTVRFSPDDQQEKTLLLMVRNNYDPLPAAYKITMAAQGLEREDLDTDAFDRDSLIGVITSDPGAVMEEEHSGVTFYTAEVPLEETATYWIGARDGYVYVWGFNGGREDPLYADVQAILDQLSFE